MGNRHAPLSSVAGKTIPRPQGAPDGGREVLSLFDEQKGTIALPREWTDQAPPAVVSGILPQAPILHPACLIQLRELAQLLKQRIDDAK